MPLVLSSLILNSLTVLSAHRTDLCVLWNSSFGSVWVTDPSLWIHVHVQQNPFLSWQRSGHMIRRLGSRLEGPASFARRKQGAWVEKPQQYIKDSLHLLATKWQQPYSGCNTKLGENDSLFCPLTCLHPLSQRLCTFFLWQSWARIPLSAPVDVICTEACLTDQWTMELFLLFRFFFVLLGSFGLLGSFTWLKRGRGKWEWETAEMGKGDEKMGIFLHN